MRRLDRYMGKTIAQSTATVMAVLLALLSFAELVNQLERVGKGSYDLVQAVQFVLLSMPRMAYELFPAAALLGTMLGLGIMASHNELMVIRTAGVSLLRIVLSIMKIGLLLMLAVVLLGEFVAPKSERFAQILRAAALTNEVTLSAEGGLWARDDENFMNIRTVLLGGRVGDVTIYQFDDAYRLSSAIHARSASYEGERWILQDVSRSQVSRNGVTTVQEEQAVWPSLLNPELFDVVSVAPEDLSTSGLYAYITYLGDNGLDARRYELAFWQKLMSPLATGVMVLIAIPFVIGPWRLTSIGQRILVGVLLGMGFHLLNQAVSRSALVYDLNLVVCTTLPTLLFLGVALALLYRAR